MYPALNQSHRRITVRLRSPNAEFLGHHPNKGVSDEAFSDIAERFSSYQVSSNRIELMLPIEHPDLDSFIKHARALNLNIEPNRAVPSQVEILDYTKFSLSEIAAADFLEAMTVRQRNCRKAWRHIGQAISSPYIPPLQHRPRWQPHFFACLRLGEFETTDGGMESAGFESVGMAVSR